VFQSIVIQGQQLSGMQDVFGGRYNDAEWVADNKTNYKGAFFDFWNGGTSGPIWNGSNNLTLGNTTYSYP
jgi:hypothetical protein